MARSFLEKLLQPLKVFAQGNFGIGVIAVIENADGTGVACLADNGDHGCLVLAFAEGKNLWLRALIHAVEVEAMEVGLHELK